ncbi:hypothetical protein ROL03_20030 [Cronobacter sakazakii]|uniref:hypothetical protein n=1 Tax=Cronobacter sakazakii TaxID=28141 RepID=UPI002893E5C4|nr:hypothetical protein [Cronobacter sakazakii]ELY2498069.1 hypothetical protein [Cronobacter muytjensii]ELY6169906.1 hypothetical protein [Cronobacter sakazakii]MDT3649530.1 hypothetical protein [Cronobacter sakazakii]
MPTRHIDDTTAAQLDELYVRCVTLTQQPVKEVEVLRLAIQKGIQNITDDDILATLSVKDSVWHCLAEKTWAELTARWPEGAITTVSFEQLAGELSATWQQFTSELCRRAIRERIKSRLAEPLSMFSQTDEDASDEEIRAAAERDTHREVEYRHALPALQDRTFSSLSTHEKALINLYSDRISFTPDGSGDFVIQVMDAGGWRNISI